VVLAVLLADTSPIGVSHQDIQKATGLDPVRVSAAVRILRLTGRMFVLGKFHDSRYFASSERMESCRAAFDAYMAELMASRKERAREKRNARGRVYWAEKPPEEKRRTRSGKKKAKPKAEPKPRHRQKPPSVSAPVTISKKPQEAWKNAEPIIPPHVKVQELQGCQPDRRFHVPKEFKGEFTKAGIGRYVEVA
jgi:hypothetical protein